MLTAVAIVVLAAPAPLELDVAAFTVSFRPLSEASRAGVLAASVEHAPLERAGFSEVCAAQPLSVSSCLQVLEASLKKAPGDREATVLRLAEAYAQHGRNTEALTVLSALKRASPPSRLLLARVLRATGEVTKSSTAWTQAITTSSLQEREPIVLEAIQVAGEWLDEAMVTKDTNTVSAARLVWMAAAPYLDAARASAARARFFDATQTVKNAQVDEALLTRLAQQRVLTTRGALRSCAENSALIIPEFPVQWSVSAKGNSTVTGVKGCLQKALSTVRFVTDRALTVRWRVGFETSR